MDIVIEGYGVEITPALRDYISTRMLKIERHAPLLGHPSMSLHCKGGNPAHPASQGTHQYQVELSADLPSTPIHCQQQGSDIHIAIDNVIDDVDRTLCKHII